MRSGVVGMFFFRRASSQSGEGLSTRECSSLFFLVLLIALLLRLYRLDDLPVGFSHQSIDHHRQVTLRFLASIRCWFGPESCSTGFPTFVQQYGLASFLHALVFYGLGVGYYQSAILAALLGVLSVVLMWRIGKILVSQEYGLLLAFMLSVSIWHITFSRHSDAEHSLPVFHALLAVYCTLRCVKSPTLLRAVVAGSIVGASWYVYATNQLIPFLWIGALPVLRLFFRTHLQSRVIAVSILCFLLVSYPAFIASFSKGYYFPIRATLPKTDNYHFSEGAGFLVILGRGLNQIFVNSQDEWFVRLGGAINLVDKIMILCGLGILTVKMRSLRGLMQGGYVLGAFILGLAPALLSSEQALRRELIALIVLLFIEGLAGLYFLKLLYQFKNIRVILLAATFCLAGMWSWKTYANDVRIPEVNSNRIYRKMATLSERFASARPVMIIATNPTTQATTRRHIEFVMTQRSLKKNPSDSNSMITVKTLDEIIHSANCSAVCQSPGQQVMFESFLYSRLRELLQPCITSVGGQDDANLDSHWNVPLRYVRCQ